MWPGLPKNTVFPPILSPYRDTPPAMHIEPKTQSLRILLEGLIDYAGLFPPASLDLRTSSRNFVAYMAGADRWVLRSFVCPAARLAELGDSLGHHEHTGGLQVTALGPAPGEQTWETALDATLDAADRFNARHSGLGVSVTSFELKLSGRIAGDPAELDKSIGKLTDRARSIAPADYFVEVTPAANDPAAVAAAVARHDNPSDPGYLGLKIRTGGVTPPDVPTSASVARFICACRDYGVPFKATAGLHHPLYHFSHEVGTRMHGFLNVFAGSIVAAVHELDTETVADLLHCSEASDLLWDDKGLTFRTYHASLDDIRRVRQDLAISFGSCSFDEPREDLLTLDLAKRIN